MKLRAESLVLTGINAHTFDCFTRLHDASRARIEDELVDDDSLYEQGSHHSAFIASDCMSRATDIALAVFSDLLDPVMAAVDGTLVIAAVFCNWRVVIKLKFYYKHYYGVMWLVWYAFRVVTELQGQQLSLTMGFQLLVWPISVALELLQELQRHGDVSGDVSEPWG